MSDGEEMLTKEDKEEKDFIKQKNDLLDLINDGYVNVPMFNHVFGNLYDEDEINDQLSFCTEYIFTQDFKYDDDTPIIDMIKNAIKKAIEIKENKSMCSVMFKKHKSTRKYKYKNKKKSQKKSGVQKKKSLRKSSTKKSLSKTKKSLKKSKVAKSLKKSLKKKL